MWVLETIFVLTSITLGWVLFGYLVFLWFYGAFRDKKKCQDIDHFPMISIIIPCRNELENIEGKLFNLFESDYPQENMEVFVVDGKSDDGTLQLLESLKDKFDFTLIKSPSKGKINQINHILPMLNGEFVINSDVDALLDKNTLRHLINEFYCHKNVAVVGAYCRPDHTLEVDSYYWDAHNKGRFLESDAGCSSIVIAPCYAFRKNLMDKFPDDVIADDIYIAFLAHTHGYQVVYSRNAMALETRNPKSYDTFIPHKFRKSNAYLREILRFLYMLPEMSALPKTMFLTRVVQLLLLPWLMLLWFLIATSLITLFRFDVVVIMICFLFLLFLLTSRIIASIDLPDERPKYSFMVVLKGYLITNLILFVTGLTYPTFRQTSNYHRVEDNDDKTKN